MDWCPIYPGSGSTTTLTKRKQLLKVSEVSLFDSVLISTCLEWKWWDLGPRGAARVYRSMCWAELNKSCCWIEAVSARRRTCVLSRGYYLFWALVITRLALSVYSWHCQMTARSDLNLGYVVIWVCFPSLDKSQLCAQGFTCLGSVQPPVSVWMESMSPQQHLNISQSRSSSLTEETKMCAHLDNKRVCQTISTLKNMHTCTGGSLYVSDLFLFIAENILVQGNLIRLFCLMMHLLGLIVASSFSPCNSF